MEQKIVIVDSQIRDLATDSVFCKAQEDIPTRYPVLREFDFGCHKYAYLGMTLPFIKIDLDNITGMFDILHSVRRMAGADAYLAVVDFKIGFFTGHAFGLADKVIVVMHKGDEDFIGLESDSEIYG